MLRRMYETVQEPLLNAATMGGEGGNDLATNPFAAFMGGMQGNEQGQGQAPGAGNGAGAGATVPNTAPLPNPWNPARKCCHTNQSFIILLFMYCA